MATAVPPRISDGSDTSIPGAATGTLAGGGALDVEGDAVRDAIDKLQKALTPSVVLDRELDARRNDAAKVASGAAYKSPYHDAHHATIVAASALLGRALGEGGVGTGFVYGAETMVRDALLMIEGAARDALRRDEGELPRLFDIAEGMRKRRDDARAAARQLVLAFSRQNAGMDLGSADDCETPSRRREPSRRERRSRRRRGWRKSTSPCGRSWSSCSGSSSRRATPPTRRLCSCRSRCNTKRGARVGTRWSTSRRASTSAPSWRWRRLRLRISRISCGTPGGSTRSKRRGWRIG